MLASLDEIPGVLESRVDWTGKRFLLKLSPEARVHDVIAQADDALGGGVRRLGRGPEDDAARSFLRGKETWMRAGQTIELSRTEAQILAERHVREAALEVHLTQMQTERLVAVLASEIAAAFERIHAEGQGIPPNMNEIFDDVRKRTLERSRTFLTEEQSRVLEEVGARAAGR